MGQSGRIVQGHVLSSAYQALSKSQIDGILGAICNRLLTFMLELEDAFPELAESEEAARDVPREQASNIFHTYVYGSENIVANGTHFSQVVQPSVSPRDLTGLLDYVRRLGVSEEDVIELQAIVEAEEVPSESEKLPPRVEGWLGRLATKSIEGAVATTAGQVVQYCAKAIAQYYGVDLGL